MVDMPWHFVAHDVSSRKHDGCGLAGDTRDTEDGGSENTGKRIRQNIFANGLPLRRAERERTFPQALRHSAERFFTRRNYGRENHQAEGKPPRQEGDVPAEKNYE